MAAMAWLGRTTGLSRSEIIRRSVRAFAAEVQNRGPKWNWVAETAIPLNPAKFPALDRPISTVTVAVKPNSAIHAPAAVTARAKKRAS